MAKQSCPVGPDWEVLEIGPDGKLRPKEGVDKSDLEKVIPKSKGEWYNPEADARVLKGLQKSARADGVLTRPEVAKLIKEAEAQPGLDAHQRNVYLHAATKYEAHKRGFSGPAGRGHSWKKNPDVKKPGNRKEFILNEMLDSSARKIDDLYRGNSYAVARDTMESIANVTQLNKDAKRVGKIVNKTGRSRPVKASIRKSFKEFKDIKIISGLDKLGEDIANILTKNNNLSARNLALSIGKLINKADTNYAGKLGIQQQLELGAGVMNRIIKDKSLPISFRKTQSDIFISVAPGPFQRATELASLKRAQKRLPTKRATKLTGSGKTNKKGNESIHLSDDVIGPTTPTAIQTKVLNTYNSSAFKVNPKMSWFVDRLGVMQKELGGSEVKLLGSKYWAPDSNRLESRYFGVSVSAREFKSDKSKVFFDHFEDSRGRIYTNGTNLNPNGDSLNKSLHLNGKATIADMTPGSKSSENFKFEFGEYLGSGQELRTISGRNRLFEANKANLLTLGRAINNQDDAALKELVPFLNTIKAKNIPPVALRAAEYAKMVDGGNLKGHFSSVRTGQDATASGPQIMSVLIQDADMARLTNVKPTIVNGEQVKQSIYDAIQPYLKQSGTLDTPVLSTLSDADWTKVFKKPVMLDLYASSPGVKRRSDGSGFFAVNKQGFEAKNTKEEIGYLSSIRKVFKEDLDIAVPDEELLPLVHTMAQAIPQRFPKFKQMTKLLQDVFRETTSDGKPMEWTTPLLKDKKVWATKKAVDDTLFDPINNKTFDDVVYTKEVDPRNTGRKAPPTIFHSLDADIAKWMKIEANKRGIQLNTNHDSFWSNLSDYGEVGKLYREGLIKIKDSNFLENMIEGIRHRVGDEKADEFLVRLKELITNDLGDDINAETLSSIFATS